jgi:hypothetical protein
MIVRGKPRASDLDLLRRWAPLFDSAFQVPGTSFRFGLDPLIGLVPGIGDLVSPMFGMAIIVVVAVIPLLLTLALFYGLGSLLAK